MENPLPPPLIIANFLALEVDIYDLILELARSGSCQDSIPKTILSTYW